MDWDDAYSNHTHIPDADSYPPRWAAKAHALRDMLSIEGRAELGVSYGDTTRQAYDLFLPEADTKELVIFVHGGYWRRFGREDWSHLAQGALDRGCAVAMPSYDLCPTVHKCIVFRYKLFAEIVSNFILMISVLILLNRAHIHPAVVSMLSLVNFNGRRSLLPGRYFLEHDCSSG